VDERDAFMFGGLGLLFVGMWGAVSPWIACAVVGSVLVVVALLSLRRR
jgi:hypothetical protein